MFTCPRRTTSTALAFFLSFVVTGNVAAPASAPGGDGYRRPPEPIASVLEAPALPVPFVSPARDLVLLATPERFPPAAESSRPTLRLDGIDIDPVANAARPAVTYVAFSLLRIADGSRVPVELPAGARASAPVWSPDGSSFAFANATAHGTELWIGSAMTGAMRGYDTIRLNALFGDAIAWFPNGNRLLLHLVDADRPAAPPTTNGPYVREARGERIGGVPSGTAGDPAESDRFAYYARGTYAVLDISTAKLDAVVPNGIYADASVSPDGRFIALARFATPPANADSWRDAGHRTFVIDRAGHTVAVTPDVPAAVRANPDAALAGPRDISWQANAPATLVWIDARHGAGDGVYALPVGSAEQPRAVLGSALHLQDIAFIEGSSEALVRDYDRRTRVSRTLELDVDARSGTVPAILGTQKDGDAFDDPGRPLEHQGPGGTPVIARDGDAIFLAGAGYTTAGLRPFLDRVDMSTHTKRRLFQSALDPLETVVAMLDTHGDSFLVRRESPVAPPDLFVRTLSTREFRQLTHYVDPAPALRTLHPRVIWYRRADGVACSFKLYLPPGVRPGTPLPTLLWAYPYEFEDPIAAGQNANFVQDFDEPGGAVARLAALAGYAVLDQVSMPIVGSPAAAGDSLVAQLTMDARAAIDKAVAIGVTDRSRVAVGGHSYGAFMVATLLAHTNLFRAGIARSGAYNRTLTPFGFQNETRSYWQAPEVYARLSPFAYADHIATPLLLIHGALDENPATPTLQSVRMFDAIRGNGGTARLVILPAEGHTYTSREGVETAEAEMLDWLDRNLKGAPLREGGSS